MLLIAFQALIFATMLNEGLGCGFAAAPELAFGFDGMIDYQMDIAAGNIAGGAIYAGLSGRNLPNRAVKSFSMNYIPFFEVFIILF